jgi:hypothetical protein
MKKKNDIREAANEVLHELVDTLMLHRGVSRKRAVEVLLDELRSMNGTYTITGRLPSELLVFGRQPSPALRRGLAHPPRFTDGRAIEPLPEPLPDQL